MAGSPTADTYSLREILHSVENSRQVVKLYNYRGPASRRVDLETFFHDQNVPVEERSTPSGRPHNFLVLHRDDAFLAADSVERVHDAVAAGDPISDPDSLESMDYPTVLERLDHTVFESYDTDTMIGISRAVEQYAWRAAEGEVHAGFQRLSLVHDQAEIYESLADRGVDVHVYGAPDDSLDYPNVTCHPAEDEEITRSWFVVFDRPSGDRRGLLAWERIADDFHGFWTTDDAPLDAVLDRLRARFPAPA